MLLSDGKSNVTQSGPQVTSHGVSAFSHVSLYTIRMFVKTRSGMFPLRALLDPGSQSSLISEKAVQFPGLQRRKSFCRVVVVGHGCNNLSKYVVSVDLWSRLKEPVLNCDAMVLPQISSYKPCFDSRAIELPKLHEASLADPLSYYNDSIDTILGSDICSRVKISSESFVFKDLLFQNTHFSWVFSG